MKAKGGIGSAGVVCVPVSASGSNLMALSEEWMGQEYVLSCWLIV